MGKFVIKNPVLTINGVDLSDHCSHATIHTEFNDVDVTGFGSNYHQIIQGLGDATITLTFQQDFAAGSVDATLWPLSQAGTSFPVTIKPTSSAVSATNPRFDMTAVLLTYDPLDGDIGDASTTDVEFRNSGAAGLTRNIA